MRRAGILGVLVLGCIALLMPPVASAAPTLQAADAGVTASFPTSLEFNVSVEGPEPVTDARLRYTIDKMNYAPVVTEAWANFEPSTSVDASWTWDMRRSSLPPGAEITYWWWVRDASGTIVETEPETVRFDDDRYDWNTIQSDDVTLYWYQGSENFARTLLDICDEAIETLAEDVGGRVDRHIHVYIYGSSSDLRSAMVYPQEWTGGVAFTDYSVVAIGIPPDDLQWGRRALRHEMTHLVVHTTTFSPFGIVPTWIDEGLAMRMEGEPAATFVNILHHSAQEDELISLRTLNGPFSSDTTKAYLSYAQSMSVVDYLFATYGSDPMHELLELLTAGERLDDALKQSYGKDLDGIESEWVAALKEQVG